jgi:hypothetical protein
VRTERLLDWVDRGGYLIVGPYLLRGQVTEETREDPLFEALGIEVEEVPEPAPRTREIVAMDSDDGEGTREVEFYAGFGLVLAEDESDEPAHYASVFRSRGDGVVMALNDTRFMRSDEIGKLAHARYLWDLVHVAGDRAGVRLVHRLQSGSIWTLAARRAWLALVVFGLLLAAWICRRAVRFGPLHPAPPRDTRALIEHVDALGHFLWRAGCADALVGGARRALERQILARRPDLAGSDRRQRVDRLAQAARLPEEAVRSALYGSSHARRDDFSRTIRTLEQLRRTL